MNERTHRVKAQYEQTLFVNRKTDGMLKRENHEVGGWENYEF